MTKDKSLTIKLDIKTALDILLVLNGATSGYSKEFVPERVARLREVSSVLYKELEKIEVIS